MTTTFESTAQKSYELDQMAAGYSAFAASYPSFNRTRLLDEWRQTQYSRLDAKKQIYLDYTGGGLYSDSQLDEHMQLLHTSVLGNPHSANPSSLAMTDLVEDTRKYVLHYFNAWDRRQHGASTTGSWTKKEAEEWPLTCISTIRIMYSISSGCRMPFPVSPPKMPKAGLCT